LGPPDSDSVPRVRGTEQRGLVVGATEREHGQGHARVRGKKREMGRIGCSQPKLDFSLFLFIFFSLPFQIQFVFKFNSNSCGPLLQFILVTFRDTNSGGIIYIYYLFLHILYLFLFSTFLEFPSGFKF
jgi:hypothetical protein